MSNELQDEYQGNEKDLIEKLKKENLEDCGFRE